MTINKGSWHAKLFLWLEDGNEDATVCKYVFTVTTFPLIMALFSPFIPMLWLAEKAANWSKPKVKLTCPFGTITFAERKQR